MEVFIGIDNGVSGALAALNKNGDVLYLSPLPLRKIGKDHTLDVRAFQETLARFAASSFVIAEQAQKFSPGKMALCSTWRCWGMIETVLELNKYRWEPINPALWQKAMFRGHVRAKDQDSKNVSIEIARRLFPNTSLIPTAKSRSPSSGLADALLIAEWARRNR